MISRVLLSNFPLAFCRPTMHSIEDVPNLSKSKRTLLSTSSSVLNKISDGNTTMILLMLRKLFSAIAQAIAAQIRLFPFPVGMVKKIFYALSWPDANNFNNALMAEPNWLLLASVSIVCNPFYIFGRMFSSAQSITDSAIFSLLQIVFQSSTSCKTCCSCCLYFYSAFSFYCLIKASKLNSGISAGWKLSTDETLSSAALVYNNFAKSSLHSDVILSVCCSTNCSQFAWKKSAIILD